MEGSRLEHSLPVRVERDQEGGLGLAWRPTGPGVLPTASTPAPVYVIGAGGVSEGGGMHPRPSKRGIENGELRDSPKDPVKVSFRT